MSDARKDSDTLEAIVDAWSLPDVVDALAQICAQKSIHLEDNWQEPGDHWRRSAEIIMSTVGRLEALHGRARGLAEGVMGS